jgi:hypothetical protein
MPSLTGAGAMDIIDEFGSVDMDELYVVEANDAYGADGETDSAPNATQCDHRALAVDGIRSCFWSVSCTLAAMPGTMFCFPHGRIVRDHAALIGETLTPALTLKRETQLQGRGLSSSVLIRQPVVNWKPVSTPWQQTQLETFRDIIRSDLVLWTVDTEYINLSQASVCPLTITIRDYRTVKSILLTTINYNNITLDKLLNRIKQHYFAYRFSSTVLGVRSVSL